MSDSRQVHAMISGRVQGVWFRAWTVEEAGARGLDGWVRNRRDGRVEAVFAGPAAAVEAMVAACHAGPPNAEVEAVAVEDWAEAVERGFHKRPTA